MKKFKHRQTGVIVDELTPDHSMYHMCGEPAYRCIPRKFVENTLDWEEIKDNKPKIDIIGTTEGTLKVVKTYPLGTKIEDTENGNVYERVLDNFGNKHHQEWTVLKSRDYKNISSEEIGEDKRYRIVDKKPEWTILKLKNRNSGIIINSDKASEQILFQYDIISVRRESDGKVFTIGDLESGSERPITMFKIINEKMWYSTDKGVANSFLPFHMLFKVKPKEWEITTFRNKKTTCYISSPLPGYSENDYSGKDAPWEIYSVKRLSDRVEFKIGDRTDCGTIISFEVREGFMEVGTRIPEGTCGCTLGELIKKEKLFTTEDGVDIYEDMLPITLKNISWDFHIDDLVIYNRGGNYSSKCPIFADNVKAEKYILMNKPCLSVNDIIESKLIIKASRLMEQYEQLVKSKLKL